MTRRDRMRARRLPTAQVPIPADQVAYAAAERYLEAAAAALAQVQGRPDVDVAAYEAAVADARAALAAQDVEVYDLRCLPPERWEELVDAHQPSDEQRKQGWQWNVATFRPAVLDACVVTPDGEEPLGVAGWVEAAREGHLSQGEMDLLFVSVVNLNVTQPRVGLGKG